MATSYAVITCGPGVGSLLDAAVEATEVLGSAPVWFRGQRRDTWALEPGVRRQARTLGIVDAAAFEQDLVHRFRSRAGVYGQGLSFERRASWLQLMQHHRLPTRLLDWSRSPLVAAYFAVEDVLLNLIDPPNDQPAAAIWVLAPHLVNARSTENVHTVTPSIDSLICASLVDGAFWGDDYARRRALSREIEWGSADGTHHATDAGIVTGPGCMAVMSNETDLRMLMQQGAFTAHAADSPLIDANPSFADCLVKIVINGPDIYRLAQQLRVCGVSEAGIYPDLDHLAADVARSNIR